MTRTARRAKEDPRQSCCKYEEELEIGVKNVKGVDQFMKRLVYAAINIFTYRYRQKLGHRPRHFLPDSQVADSEVF